MGKQVYFFGNGRAEGTKETRKWVRDGMTFYLQDAGQGRSRAAELNTLGTVTARVRSRETTISVPSRPPCFKEPSFIALIS